MVTKNAEAGAKAWYWKNNDGTKKGPFDISSVRNLVVSGDLSAQTQVSSNGTDWLSAVSCPDLGFDCIVLEVGESLNVLGPFAREYIDRHDVMSSVPSDGILFVRGGTVGEALPGCVSGTTGAVLVEKVMTAEKELRESIKAKRTADASLAAKDLEFDAERQKLNGIISGMKATELKTQSELEGLHSELAGQDVDKIRYSKLEAKLVDAENAAAKMAAEAVRRGREEKEAARKLSELNAAISKAQVRSADFEKKCLAIESKYAELEQRFTETGRKLTEREGRCVELEGRIADSAASIEELKSQILNYEAKVLELQGEVENAHANDATYRESVEWLREKLADFSDEVAARFYSSPSGSTDSRATFRPATEVACTAGMGFEEVQPEIVPQGKGDSTYAIKLRTFKKGESAQPQMAKLSAIENQLKREISSLGASKNASGATGHDGFIGVFKRRK